MPVDTTYTLEPIPPTTTGGAAGSLPRAAEPYTDFLGFGLLSPFRRGASDFVASGGDAFVASMVSEVLGTRCDSDFTDGELPWRPEFGSLLHLLRHRRNDATTAELARVYVAEALARWIPQIRLKAVTTEKKEGPNTGDGATILLVRIVYDIVAVNRPGNEVLAPGISQVVALTV